LIVSIEKVENKLDLFFENKINISTKYQLDYFKLSSKKKNIFTGNLDTVDIESIIDYLKKNNFKVNLSEAVKKYLQLKKNKDIEYKNDIKKLLELKKNQSSNDYISFCNQFNYLARELKPHQLKSLYHLYHAKCAANFSVPGSGKTSVVLSYYEKLKKEGKVNALFIIGPKSCYFSWKEEFKFTLGRDPNLTILGDTMKLFDRKNIYKNNVKNELYASHFQTINNDIEFLLNFFSNNKFLLVVDEAHNIKKIGGTWSNAALKLSSLSNYKVILTGTPMPNDFKDFYNYLDFLYNKNNILSPIEKAELQKYMDDKNFDKASDILTNKLSPFYTRVTKKELKLSKPIFNKPVLIKMNPIEGSIYDAIVNKIKYFPIKEYEQNIDLIRKIRKARIIRLRQCCSYVKNLNTVLPEESDEIKNSGINNFNIQDLITNYDEKETPAKLSKLKEMVLELSNAKKKVLIWSTHLETIDLILGHLNNLGIIAKKITGKTDLEEREDIKEEFNNAKSNLKALVANPQACSESISLHKACQNAVYYDLNYNTAEFLQSLDRIHRVGGSENNPVTYDFLHYEDSIDEKVYQKVFQKADRQMQIIESENLTFQLLEDDNTDQFYSELENDL